MPTLTLTEKQEELLVSKIDATGPCWEWVAGRFNSGYGVFHIDRKAHRAHRVVYEWLVGEIPTGLQPDHLCRVKHCVNPDHIELVSARTNTLRSHNPAAKRARQKSCIRGHRLSGKNLYVTPDGRRQCKECGRLRANNFQQRKGGG